MPLADMLQQAPQAPQAPQQGMMQEQSQGWSGTVNVQGQPVQVQNGVGEFQGKKYFVSNDGMIVADEQRNLIGIVQDGVFVQATKEIAAQLKEQGILE